jgi:hypothetical protein
LKQKEKERERTRERKEREGEGEGEGKENGGANPSTADALVPVEPISDDHPILEHTTTYQNQNLTGSRRGQAVVEGGGTTSSTDAPATRETLLQSIYLTEGSFGKISYFPYQDNVYKTVLQGDKESAKRLLHEYEM